MTPAVLSVTHVRANDTTVLVSYYVAFAEC
jgi:hypothetical protein